MILAFIGKYAAWIFGLLGLFIVSQILAMRYFLREARSSPYFLVRQEEMGKARRSGLFAVLLTVLAISLVTWLATSGPRQVAQVTPTPRPRAWRTPTTAGQPVVTATPSPAPPPAATPVPTSEVVVEVTPTPVTHTVRPGESLAVIAAMYGTTVEAIVEANGLTDPRLIQVGRVLIIPGATAVAMRPPTDTAAPATNTPTAVPPTDTPLPPTDTPVPTDTAIPATDTPTAVPPTDTPTAEAATVTPAVAGPPKGAPATPPSGLPAETELPSSMGTPFPDAPAPRAGANFSDVTLAQGVTEDYKPINPGDVFPAGDKRMYAFFKYEALSTGVVWSNAWYRDGQELGSDTTTWPASYGSYGRAYRFFELAGGYPPGQYEVRFYIGDELKAAATFTVQ